MKYSIIIPTYNHLEDCLKPCLTSVLEYTDFSDTEIIVVANGCTDGTREYLETLPNHVKILWCDDPLGYTRATNEGIKVSQGKYIILLNNDCVLLGQNKNMWIDMLVTPFLIDSKTGITGISKVQCKYSLRQFIIFFCVMIDRSVFQKIGLLDESFSPGGGDDIDFCIRTENAGFKLVQVPEEKAEWSYSTNFPIYHKAEGTFSTYPNWEFIFQNNMNKIKEKYNIQHKYGNNFERAVIEKNQVVPPREAARYTWARQNIVGKKVLEIGCSSGYGLKFIGDIEGLDYLGIDYDKSIVDFATSQFGPFFKHADINTFNFDQYDTIIAFEVLEHIPNGKEIAQKLKQHCKCLLATCPYNETPGFWGQHHVLHNLLEKDFPDFKYSFMDDVGNISNIPHNTEINLMLMKWGGTDQEIITFTEHSFQPLVKLNIGSGEDVFDGFINCDLYSERAQVKCSATALTFPDEYADLIYTGHMIEHLDFHEGLAAIKEFKRVLKTGGTLEIECPNLDAICLAFVKASESEKVDLYRILFGSTWEKGGIHKFLYTPSQMRWSLNQYGFKNIRQAKPERHPDIESLCMKFVCEK